MSQAYMTRRKAQRSPIAQETAHTEVSGPSMQELAAGAAPSRAQMGHRVDLPEAIRAKMEASFGADFSNVRLYESRMVADAGADAMAMGSVIGFAPGKLDLVSSAGQAMLGHELSHVVTQARGEVHGRGFLADHALEARANREGALAAAGESVYSGPVAPLSASAIPGSTAGVAQAIGKSEQKRIIAMKNYRRDIAEDDADRERLRRHMESVGGVDEALGQELNARGISNYIARNAADAPEAPGGAQNEEERRAMLLNQSRNAKSKAMEMTADQVSPHFKKLFEQLNASDERDVLKAFGEGMAEYKKYKAIMEMEAQNDFAGWTNEEAAVFKHRFALLEQAMGNAKAVNDYYSGVSDDKDKLKDMSKRRKQMLKDKKDAEKKNRDYFSPAAGRPASDITPNLFKNIELQRGDYYRTAPSAPPAAAPAAPRPALSVSGPNEVNISPAAEVPAAPKPKPSLSLSGLQKTDISPQPEKPKPALSLSDAQVFSGPAQEPSEEENKPKPQMADVSIQTETIEEEPTNDETDEKIPEEHEPEPIIIGKTDEERKKDKGKKNKGKSKKNKEETGGDKKGKRKGKKSKKEEKPAEEKPKEDLGDAFDEYLMNENEWEMDQEIIAQGKMELDVKKYLEDNNTEDRHAAHSYMKHDVKNNAGGKGYQSQIQDFLNNKPLNPNAPKDKPQLVAVLGDKNKNEDVLKLLNSADENKAKEAFKALEEQGTREELRKLQAWAAFAGTMTEDTKFQNEINAFNNKAKMVHAAMRDIAALNEAERLYQAKEISKERYDEIKKTLTDRRAERLKALEPKGKEKADGNAGSFSSAFGNLIGKLNVAGTYIRNKHDELNELYEAKHNGVWENLGAGEKETWIKNHESAYFTYLKYEEEENDPKKPDPRHMNEIRERYAKRQTELGNAREFLAVKKQKKAEENGTAPKVSRIEDTGGKEEKPEANNRQDGAEGGSDAFKDTVKLLNDSLAAAVENLNSKSSADALNVIEQIFGEKSETLDNLKKELGDREELDDDALLLRDILTQAVMRGTQQDISSFGSILGKGLDVAKTVIEKIPGADTLASVVGGVAKAGEVAFKGIGALQDERITDKLMEQVLGISSADVEEFMETYKIDNIHRAKQALLKASEYSSGKRAELVAEQTAKRSEKLVELAKTGNMSAIVMCLMLGGWDAEDEVLKPEKIAETLGLEETQEDILVKRNYINFRDQKKLKEGNK